MKDLEQFYFKPPTPGDFARKKLAQQRERFLVNIPKNGYEEGTAVLYGQEEIIETKISVDDYLRYLECCGDFESVRIEEKAYGTRGNFYESRSSIYVIDIKKGKKFLSFLKSKR